MQARCAGAPSTPAWHCAARVCRGMAETKNPSRWDRKGPQAIRAQCEPVRSEPPKRLGDDQDGDRIGSADEKPPAGRQRADGQAKRLAHEGCHQSGSRPSCSCGPSGAPLENKPFAPPVTISVARPRHYRDVTSVREAAECLMARWPEGEAGDRPAYAAALQACHDTLAGRRTAAHARRRFVAAASEAGILIAAES